MQSRVPVLIRFYSFVFVKIWVCINIRSAVVTMQESAAMKYIEERHHRVAPQWSKEWDKTDSQKDVRKR